MKTLEEILNYKGGGSCNFLDGRDCIRLSCFLTVEQWSRIGLEPKEGADVSDHQPEPFTEENVRKHLACDLDFAFEKALDQRGISASLMYDVVKMWLWVLDDPLADWQEYAQYGLPLLKQVAVKYGLPNPIGDDYGDEGRYAG